MNITETHEDFVLEAVRVPAANASLFLLDKGEAVNPSTIELYANPLDPPLVIIPMTARAGVVEDVEIETVRHVRIVIDTPIEGQVIGAASETGSVPVLAVFKMPDGTEWGDCTVSDEAGAGELKMASDTLFNGAFARINSAVFER